MALNPNQPRAYDAVLGGTPTSYPLHAAVLGGLAGVKHRFASTVVNQQVAAIKDAIKYGQEGFSLIFDALKDSNWQIRHTAYSLLKGVDDPRLQQLLPEYNPYQFLRCLYRHATAQSTVYALAISSDEQLLASGATDKTIKVRSLHTGKILSTLTGHLGSVSAIALHPHQPILVSGSWDTTIKVWNLENISLSNQLASDRLILTYRGHESKINTVAISPDGQVVGSGSQDGKIDLWHIRTGEVIDAIALHTNGVTSLAFTPNGQTLVSGGAECTIHLWDWQSKELKHSFTKDTNSVKSIAISPDGQILARGSQDKAIELWHLPTGQLLNKLIGHWGEVNGLAISQDGQTLVSCSWDETIRLWHLPTGTLLHSLTGHQGAVVSVAISPDALKIVTSSQDRTIRVWGMG
ncbi:MAG TPA: WD40 repeat domain-containing protein [Cyanobacteria bacterium UBA8803]|nr:WD40 repeat domain-containing protein [Cyanobacteria bacterium UBA9273]HBL57275.1 WD40 repeat domain-containing protein [Cyanobacteria bacterium UBA8803]